MKHLFSEKVDRGLFYPNEIKLSAFVTKKESTILGFPNVYVLVSVSIYRCMFMCMCGHVDMGLCPCVCMSVSLPLSSCQD